LVFFRRYFTRQASFSEFYYLWHSSSQLCCERWLFHTEVKEQKKRERQVDPLVFFCHTGLVEKNSKIVIVAAAVVLLTATFAFGTWYGYAHQPAIDKVLKVENKTNPASLQNVDFSLFWDVWNRLEEKYVDKSNLDRQKMVFGAISGLVDSAQDPYTVFMPPREAKQFQEDIKGAFEGIGAEIGLRKGVLTVISPLKGSPAEGAGLKAADKILKVDGASTANLSLDEAVRLIRGEKGTQVTLTVFRDGVDHAIEIKIIRDTIKVQIINTEQKPNGVFVIRLSTFTESAALEFRKAVQDFFESGSKKLILDLRNNPGGYLTVAVDIASWWLYPGEVVVREKNYDDTEDVFRSGGYKLLQDVPTVILVNEGSASASEILSGALRDSLGVKLIGAKTFGKGSVQEVENLSGGASLKITIAKWLTPKGEEINGKGLEPDVKVELPQNPEEEESLDPVMDKALEFLAE